METLDVLRLLIGAGFLLYASVLDWRTRRVPNNVWIALASLAALLFAVDWLLVERLSWFHLVVAVIIAALAYVLWYFHLLAGGADAKAVMALGLLLPHTIEWEFLERSFPLWTSPTPGALVVVANSVLIFGVAPLVLFLVNLGQGHVRVPAMFFGYSMPLSRAAASFVWIVDRIDAEGRNRYVLFPSRISDEEYAANVERLRQAGRERVWVTPKIPFMIPLFVGFVVAFFAGDVLFRIVEAVVRELRG